MNDTCMRTPTKKRSYSVQFRVYYPWKDKKGQPLSVCVCGKRKRMIVIIKQRVEGEKEIGVVVVVVDKKNG